MSESLFTVVPCVLGCRALSGNPFPSVPGYLTCEPCTERLRVDLREIVDLYASLDDALLPGAGGATAAGRGAPGFASRSPVRDSVLALTDARTQAGEDGDPLPVLDVLSSWVDNLRQDAGMVPQVSEAELNDALRLLGWLEWTTRQPWAVRLAGPVAELHERAAALLGVNRRTVSGEVALLLRWLGFITRQYWVGDMAAEVAELRRQLRVAHGLVERTVPVGTCPTMVVHPGEREPRPCDARLRARLTSDRITCPSCRAFWTRDRWEQLGHALGSPVSDLASISAWLEVPVGTLRRWRSEDGWTRQGSRNRPLYPRTEVLVSWQRRRGSQARPA
ncbi:MULTISPECIES: hypothetical protein [unclassified Crossiella]|uniref:hypothetical protein n=1 Tax=unclassified Crossiella TaxID=2620835 RepID=UPI001FFE9867|nr:MULTISPECIES: hypothetical protein [unclassified Crossiella]MCK2239381.1 hypothetical protein [Crossiella sp. S99.2]MCK2252076.1 hypothetical protein [Crossiella sp. S99.1]